jgi:predicted nuclease of restriction endonuclease-like (RecB) superfamily
MKIQNPKSREYYLQEAIEQQWSFRQLERQVSSFYYERVLASKDKELVKSEVNQNAVKIDAREIIKDPFVLEFLDIAENTNYLEKDLEQAIIDKLQLFMLELGKGFAFVARQKRISTEAGKHYYIDLVFYNYILKCFVLIDLKVGTLTPQDVGQMDMYVRMYEKIIRQHNDNPTIGIILCSQNDKTVVEFSVLEENKQLFASQYQLYLPTKEQLIAEIERNIENL